MESDDDDDDDDACFAQFHCRNELGLIVHRLISGGSYKCKLSVDCWGDAGVENAALENAGLENVGIKIWQSFNG